MFEVEQKFILSEKDVELLIEGASFVGEKTFTDTYYDTAEFALTKNNMWLRKRGEKFELKIPMHEAGNGITQQYQEIEGAEKIREIFSIAPVSDFETDIAVFGYQPFCECTTTRKKYHKNEFVIDLDVVTCGDDFVYNIGEIELMVEEKSQITEAIKKIEVFVGANDLEIAPVRGKVIEYLKRKKPDHYQALVEAGVVSE